MEEFNNIEMKDEELDQVAGGVRTATFERLENGKIRLTTHIDEIVVEEDGTKTSVHSDGEMPIKEKYLQKAIEKYKERGFEIIFKGFEGI